MESNERNRIYDSAIVTILAARGYTGVHQCNSCRHGLLLSRKYPRGVPRLNGPELAEQSQGFIILLELEEPAGRVSMSSFHPFYCWMLRHISADGRHVQTRPGPQDPLIWASRTTQASF